MPRPLAASNEGRMPSHAGHYENQAPSYKSLTAMHGPGSRQPHYTVAVTCAIYNRPDSRLRQVLRSHPGDD